jgi:alpha-amylase
MAAGSPTLEIAYLLENVPSDIPLHFGVEMNFAGLPSGADDRYFHDAEGTRLGQLGKQLDLADVTCLGMTDEWLGIDVVMKLNRPTDIWTFPVETVSQSEGGFELVHQSVCTIPHWLVRGDAAGKWSVTMHLTASTALAESRMRPAVAQAVAAGA